MTLRIYFFILFLISACNSVPDTPCECHDAIVGLTKEITDTDRELRKFELASKDTYADDIQAFYKRVKEGNELLLNCKDIYHKQGLCKQLESESLWDIGEGLYFPNESFYIETYTGNWVQDSTRQAEEKLKNGFENPHTLIPYLQREHFDSIIMIGTDTLIKMN